MTDELFNSKTPIDAGFRSFIAEGDPVSPQQAESMRTLWFAAAIYTYSVISRAAEEDDEQSFNVLGLMGKEFDAFMELR